MANLRNPPPIERRNPGCGPHPGAAGPSRPHLHSPHSPSAADPGAEAREFYAGRFQLAGWLLERLDLQAARSAAVALVLVLANLILASVMVLTTFRVAQIIDPSLWLLRLLVLLIALLLLAAALAAALLALLSALRLRSVGGPPAEVEAEFFFHAGEADPALSESEFRQHFLQTTRQQMLEGAIAALYRQRRRRARQVRWLRWAMVITMVAVLLAFVLAAVWMVVGFVL